MRKNKMAKACDISSKTRKEVYKRDGDFCVFCGKFLREKELAHIVNRSQGGLGIPQNLVTLGSAFECECHYIFDSGTKAQKQAMKDKFIAYLKGFYPDWNEDGMTYRRWE